MIGAAVGLQYTKFYKKIIQKSVFIIAVDILFILTVYFLTNYFLKNESIFLITSYVYIVAFLVSTYYMFVLQTLSRRKKR
jgi:uncharacterized membrane protein